MALIGMAVYDTQENDRTQYTIRTIECLLKTVNFGKHRVVIVDNASCEATQHYLERHPPSISVIRLDKNIGTARAINKAWQRRGEMEHCVKMDNDVIIEEKDWADVLEFVLNRDPTIGIVGLKRKDCLEHPDNPRDWYHSDMHMLKHVPGEPWIPLEQVNHVMGTCQMYNWTLLQKIGYLYQPGLYGFDDALASVRAKVAGFRTVFVPHIKIDHIDPGGTEFQSWKEKYSGEQMDLYYRLKDEYESKKRSVYSLPNEEFIA